MMYDIYFDPALARWRLRMVYPMLVFFSTTREVYGPASNNDSAAPRSFETFGAAQDYATKTGLKDAYTMRYPKRIPGMREVLNGSENYAHQTAQLTHNDQRIL
jgi:hypothetical protein